MTYIENIFVCIAIPLALSLIFLHRSQRRFTAFVLIGMFVCMLSAYVNSFFMNYYQVDSITAAVEITPVCEEIMQFIPLLLYILIFEPEAQDVLPSAIAIATGFETLENACYLTENGAENFWFLLMRGISAGALHILCGTIMGLGMAYVFNQSWIALTGTVGLIGACVTLHGIYNLLIVAGGTWRDIGYAVPSMAIIFVIAAHKMRRRLMRERKTEDR